MTEENDRPDPLHLFNLHLPRLNKAAAGVCGLGELMQELLIQKCGAEEGEKTLIDNASMMSAIYSSFYYLGSFMEGTLEFLEEALETCNPTLQPKKGVHHDAT